MGDRGRGAADSSRLTSGTLKEQLPSHATADWRGALMIGELCVGSEEREER